MLSDKFYLILVISAFAVFGLTLAVESWLDTRRFGKIGKK